MSAKFQALLTIDGLIALDHQFIEFVKKNDASLIFRLKEYRESGDQWSKQKISEWIIAFAPYVDTFLTEYFGISESVAQLKQDILLEQPIFQFKAYYIEKHAKRLMQCEKINADFYQLNNWLLEELKKYHLVCADDTELAIAKLGVLFLNDEKKHSETREKLIQWCALILQDPDSYPFIQCWKSFSLPHKKDFKTLVRIESVQNDPFARFEGLKSTQRQRAGFALTDQRASLREVINEINYCVYCHKNEGDFCSKGFPIKKNEPMLGFKSNAAGELLTGCPLEEKISEMHVLKKSGYNIGALATVMIDNPMCAATGHRICNDCMKSCIYQKQDPVNIPQIETRVLTDVLQLPWGVEIYLLLMQWNPLRYKQYLPKPYNGAKVLIIGMGPAGFTLAHHLLMEGCAVVGTDGLKIEPLDEELLKNPIMHFNTLTEPLDDRVMTGFGGVAEYGITVRWDKNFLKLIYLGLARRAYFQVFGSVRFGGTITVESAWNLGFDHISLAVGAGLPRELPIPNSLAPGMRQANDFLMALQLTGAIKSSSLAVLQVRLPAVVIGGGLTAIDTATEVQAYYVTQVEKIHHRYHLLKNHLGENKLRAHFDEHHLIVLDEFLSHAEKIIAEREKARFENRTPHLISFIREWGGVTVAYRKSMQESPAYQRNHEEIIKALEEGIYYAEGLEPVAVQLDVHGEVNALLCRSRILNEEGKWIFSDEEQIIPTKSLFVATGAKPNVAYSFEHKDTFAKHNTLYQSYELQNNQLHLATSDQPIKTKKPGIFTSYENEGRYVTFIGDTHPVFHGSVVKAIASASRGYSDIVNCLKNKINHRNTKDYRQFKRKMSELFEAKVVSVRRLSNKIIELTVKAPMAAEQFQPGQLYRIQNYERYAIRAGDSHLKTESISSVGIYNNHYKDQLSFLILEKDTSTRLVSTFSVDQSISIMGPTGAKTKIPEKLETLLFVGDELCVAHVLSVAPALKRAGHRVIFIGLIDSHQNCICDDQLRTLIDTVYWCFDMTDLIETIKMTDAAQRYDIKTISVVGSTALLKTLQNARYDILSHCFHPEVKWIASVYGSMQCMLKGVCAQCLQWQIDPATGKRTKAVYACSWQHQPMEIVDIDHIDERVGQSAVQETLTNLWLNYLIEKYDINKI